MKYDLNKTIKKNKVLLDHELREMGCNLNLSIVDEPLTPARF